MRKEPSTSALFRGLFVTTNLRRFLAANHTATDQPPFHAFLQKIAKEKGVGVEQVARAAAIERTYAHQLFNGRRKPSRDKVIQLAFGLGLDMEAAQKLLRAARKSELYPRILRDAVLIYCLKKGMPVLEVQDMLYDYGVKLLGGEEKNGK